MAAIALPRIMDIGAGSSATLGDLLTRLGISRPLVVADAALVASGLADGVLGSLAKAGIPHGLFTGIVPDPTVASIDAGLAALREAPYDAVVGFGGGSALDSAKAIAVVGCHGGRPSDYKVPHVEDRPGLPIIAIPTTAGTGSEATRFAIVTDEATDEKMLCAGLAYLPVAALVDYELTLRKPERLTVDTAIDSLTHAIEAYVSRRANPFSDGFARLAMANIMPFLRRVVADPQDRVARERLMLGALQGGIAFSNSSVALVHGMSRPIGAHFHMPHGLSNAILLPAVTEFSSASALPRYADCARAMGIAGDEEGDQSAVARLHVALRALNKDLRVPGPRAFGISAEKWHGLAATMAAQALASGSPGNNPRVATAEEIMALYGQVWAEEAAAGPGV